MGNVQGSSINDAWTNARAFYERNLDKEQQQTVKALTSPKDIVKHMEQLETNRKSSHSGKLMNRVKSITDRLVRFSKLVDVMASSNAEASLIWGSLKLLLTIVHQFSEEYERICQSLVTVGESLQVVDLLAETFSHSSIVSACVVNYYCSILHFWRKAIKHYRRRKFVNVIRSAWHDYTSEFGEFEALMTRLRTQTQEAAAAVDMNEARKARQQQDKFIVGSIDKLRTAEESRRHREVVQWLTPSARDASYYVDDFESAYRDRHPGTCEWILSNPRFQQWLDCDGTDPQVRMLWISAIAGAGKTVLASFIIARCRAQMKPPTERSILYFFFKNTDDEKDSFLSMTRSFLHQLYVSFGTDDFNHDILSLKEDSGQDRMLSDKRAWQLFSKHAKKMSEMTIVLDALDECKLGDIDELLNGLCLLVRELDIRVIATSRREDRIQDKLNFWPCIQIQKHDLDSDIERFVVAKIGNIARLNSGSLRDRIVRTLLSRHEGMFLWVFLMIKELKSLATVKEVEDRLLAAPKGLKEMHQGIIRRLDMTLSSSERPIALKVLSWVISAIRPLRLAEIHEILRFEKNDLLYSEKDLELICGSLVTTRNGVLQLIHLSTKEILQKRPSGMSVEDACWPFYVDARTMGPQIGLLCVSYIVNHQCSIHSYTTPDLSPTSRLEPQPGHFDVSRITAEAPFIEYAYSSWQGHLVDGDVEGEVVHELQSLLSYRFTVLWLEFRLALDPESLWKLEHNCIAMRDWLLQSSIISRVKRENGFAFLRAWCEAVLRLLKDHGLLIRKSPHELLYIDIRPFFSSSQLTEFQSEMKDDGVREQLVDLFEGAQPKPEVDPHRRLLPQPEDRGVLGFVIYDEKRDVFYYSEDGLPSGMERLWVQDRRTGRRLPPLYKTLTPTLNPGERGHLVLGAAFSRDGRYLGILYLAGSVYTTIWEIEDKLDFHDIKQSQAWARRLQCLHTTHYGYIISQPYCCPLTVGPDGLFATPHGLVDPHRGVAHPLDPECRDLPAFSGDGRILFYADSRKIYKVFWRDPSPPTEILHLPGWVPSANHTISVRGISHDGDYLVFKMTPLHYMFSGSAYLMDTRTGAVNSLWGRDCRPELHVQVHRVVFWNHSLIIIE